jgi:hypothetical protein
MATKVSIRGLAATVTQLAAGPSNLKSVTITNSSAAAAFVQFFDLAPGSVTLGTTVPILQYEVGAGLSVAFAYPGDAALLFGVAISVASTTTDGGLTGSAATVTVTLGVA